VVDRLAEFIARTQPGMRGFTRPNLFRMRQFYEAYRDHKKVSPLVRQLPWTHNLIILGQSKLQEERECISSLPENRMYGENLTMALLAALLASHEASNRALDSGLARWQLRRVLEFLEANLAEDIGLDELPNS
jgi:hypothetical protein